ncbi:YjcZ family sporulation protein [Lederbergia citrea]|uniref:YjcZ family sporulation protein n=1 Tax=Lederbergia citrea TaxID=2833581 RepID=UPI003D28016F
MYPNLNAPPTLGANVAPNVAPMPTYTAPAYDYGCPSPVYSYGCPIYRNDFVLIVVLFILLIIVGASCFGFSKC